MLSAELRHKTLLESPEGQEECDPASATGHGELPNLGVREAPLS